MRLGGLASTRLIQTKRRIRRATRAADLPAMGAQGGMYARAAIAAAAGLVRGADLGRHRAVLDRPRALGLSMLSSECP